MSGLTRYLSPEASARGTAITVQVQRITRAKQPNLDLLRSILAERNELLIPESRVDIEADIERLMEAGRKRRELAMEYDYRRLCHRKAIYHHTYSIASLSKEERLKMKREKEAKSERTREERNKAAEAWEDAEDELEAQIMHYFPDALAQASLAFTERHKCMMSELKDKYIQLANNGQADCLSEIAKKVNETRASLDYWNAELFKNDKEDLLT